MPDVWLDGVPLTVSWSLLESNEPETPGGKPLALILVKDPAQFDEFNWYTILVIGLPALTTWLVEPLKTELLIVQLGTDEIAIIPVTEAVTLEPDNCWPL